jgi:hypothetical protein
MYGTMFCEIPCCDVKFLTSSVGVSMYVKVNLCKVTGGSETIICSQYSGIVSWGVSGTQLFIEQKYFAFPIVVPVTKLNRGDIIRVTVEFWAKKDGAQTYPGIMFAYDPLNRAIPAIDAAGATGDLRVVGPAGYTQMRFKIPFRIDT